MMSTMLLLLIGVAVPVSAAEPLVSVDALGDPLPAGALMRFGTVRLRHGGPVWAVAFSRDGKMVASGGGETDPTIRLWDTASGREIGVLRGHQSQVTGVAFSPDGKQLFSCSLDDTVRVWNVATAAEVRQLSRRSPLSVTSLALAHDGKRLATAHFQEEAVRLWDVTRNVQTHTLPVKDPWAVAFAPGGGTLATVSRAGDLAGANAVRGPPWQRGGPDVHA
jgi:WD40 repeat protein